MKSNDHYFSPWSIFGSYLLFLECYSHLAGIKYWIISLVVEVITCENIEFITHGLRPLVINTIFSLVIFSNTFCQLYGNLSLHYFSILRALCAIALALLHQKKKNPSDAHSLAAWRQSKKRWQMAEFNLFSSQAWLSPSPCYWFIEGFFYYFQRLFPQSESLGMISTMSFLNLTRTKAQNQDTFYCATYN